MRTQKNYSRLAMVHVFLVLCGWLPVRPTSQCLKGSTVTATIGIGPRSKGVFGITTELDVYLPILPESEATKPVKTTDGIC